MSIFHPTVITETLFDPAKVTLYDSLLVLLHRYTPVIAETQLDQTEVSFVPDNKRKSLFQGMKFVFLSQKQVILSWNKLASLCSDPYSK